MPDRPSLLDDKSFDAIGRDKVKEKKSGSDSTKLILVVVLFVVAGLIYAWYLGVLPFGSGGETAAKKAASKPISPELKAEIERQQEELEKAYESGRVIPHGS